MQILEINMLGRRDIDKQTNWSHEFQSEQYTNETINFVTTMKINDFLIHDDIPQSVNYENLNNKQENQNNFPLLMIIQGTTGTCKSYVIGAISEALHNLQCHINLPYIYLHQLELQHLI